VSSNHRRSYVALVAALREEFNDRSSLEALWIQMRQHRYDISSLGVLAQAVHDAHDPVYDVAAAVADSCTCPGTAHWADPDCVVHQGRRARGPKLPRIGPGCICDGSGRTCPRHGAVI
jgi:hypothetical protein